MVFVTDTHALFWFLTGDKRLGKKALKLFEKTENENEVIIIPSIVLVELNSICSKKGKNDDFNQLIDKLENNQSFYIFPLNIKIIKSLQTLSPISESHDKIIVATAKLSNAVLITKDKEIIFSNIVKTIW